MTFLLDLDVLTDRQATFTCVPVPADQRVTLVMSREQWLNFGRPSRVAAEVQGVPRG